MNKVKLVLAYDWEGYILKGVFTGEVPKEVLDSGWLKTKVVEVELNKEVA